MKATVILCTYNRSQQLAKALQSASALWLPEPEDWEVLVVDNNSSDQTRQVVEDFCRLHPGRFRYLYQARQGKSHALNTGISEARGDYIAFTDDDVTVEPMWLYNLIAPLRSGDWAGVGGRTRPDRSLGSFRWLALDDVHVRGSLALFEFGAEARELTEAPMGNNMAFRREMFEKYGSFRTDLGPQPRTGNPQKCEDSEFGHRLLVAGERLIYQPSAVVYHEIPERRVQKKYFLEWWFDKARSEVRAFGIPVKTKWCVGGVPLVFFRRLIVWTLRWLFTVHPSRRFICRLKVWTVAGYILESYRLSADAKLQLTKESNGTLVL
jgi:glucosyl-dolichyl phosphate glucuronosyltransferase